MRKFRIPILLVMLYCFPFVYFSMHQDFANQSLLGYLVMLVTITLLAFFCKLYSQSSFIILGNLLSAIISFYLISEMSGDGRWDSYFKPFSPYQLFILISVLNLIPQFLAVKLAHRHRNKIKTPIS